MTDIRHLTQILSVAGLHAGASLATIGLVAFAESLALVGTFVPAALVMFAAGVLVGHGVLAIWQVLLVATVGAIAGDAVSYELGRTGRVRDSGVVKRHAHILARASALLGRHGGKAILMARFTGAVRAVVPLMAGMATMRRRLFYPVNILSAMLWAPAHILPGVLFGASLQVAEAVSGRIAVLLVIIVSLAWFLQWAVRRFLRVVVPAAGAVRSMTVAWAHRTESRLRRPVLALLDPDQPGSHALLLGCVFLIGAGWLFLGVLEDLVSGDPLIRADVSVFRFLQQLRTSPADHVMVALTEMGSGGVLMPVIVIVSCWLAWRRAWRTLGYWIANAVVGEMLLQVVKLTLGRHRPTALYTGIEQFSFPSGHVTVSTVVLGFLAFLVSRGQSIRSKMVVALCATTYVSCVAASRLYLGAHWLSDVVGGVGLGLSWISFLGMVYTHRGVEEDFSARGLAAVALAATAVAASAWLSWHGEVDRKFYAVQREFRRITPQAWSDSGWRLLPRRRREIAGEEEERLDMQMACSATDLMRRLASDGWQPSPAWALRSVLALIEPGVPLRSLPVLPKFDQGQRSTLLFVRDRPGGQRAQREVLRFWPSSLRVQRLPGEELPVWYGAAYVEKQAMHGGVPSALVHEFSEPASEVIVRSDTDSQVKLRADAEADTLLMTCGS